MSFALSAHLIIYYLETLLPILPSLVPFAHFTFDALLMLFPRGAFLLPAPLSVSFLESRVSLDLSIRNINRYSTETTRGVIASK